MYNMQCIYIYIYIYSVYTVIQYICFERQITSWSCKWCWINFNNNHLVQVRQGICQKLLVILHAEVCSNHHIPTSKGPPGYKLHHPCAPTVQVEKVYFAKNGWKKGGKNVSLFLEWSLFFKRPVWQQKCSFNLKSGKKNMRNLNSHHPSPDFIYPGTPGQSLKSSSFSILWYGPQSSQHRRLVICDHRT